MTAAPLMLKQLARDTPFSWYLYDLGKRHARFRIDDFEGQTRKLAAYTDAVDIAYQSGFPIIEKIDPSDWGSRFILGVLAHRYQISELNLQIHTIQHTDQSVYQRELTDAWYWCGAGQEYLEYQAGRLFQQGCHYGYATYLAVANALGFTLSEDLIDEIQRSSDPLMLSRLLGYLGEHGDLNGLALVQRYYQSPQLTVAFSAARAGCLLGDPRGYKSLAKYALHTNVHMLEALSLIFYFAPDVYYKTEWLKSLWDNIDAPLRSKLYAVGVSGLAHEIVRIFPYVANEETSRAAGEVFTLLTGVDLELHDLDTSASSDSCHASDLKSLKQRRKLDPFISDWEDDLPMPCPDSLEQWWYAYRECYQRDEVYLGGLPQNEENLVLLFKTGNQPIRKLAAQCLRQQFNHPWRDTGWPLWLQLQGVE